MTLADRKLRIALFTDSALPILNGVSVSIDALVRELRDRGHSVHIFTAAHFRYKDPDPNTHRFFAAETPWTKGYPLAFPPFYPMLVRVFRRHEFDIIHTHSPFTIGFVGLRWGQSHGLPVVSTYHTLYDKYTHYIPFFPKSFLRYKLAKHTNFYYNSVDQVIVPSVAAQRWLQRHNVKKPIHVIPTGIPQPRPHSRPDARERLGVGPDRQMLLYVGRVAREKNMDTLLRAVALAFAKNPRLVFFVVGDGPMRDECVSLASRLGIGDRVRFVGFVPREQVDEYYAAADLFVFASVTETQGLVVGEAMSHGLPAVLVNGGGAAAAVRDGVNGLVVRNDAEALAEKLLEVTADPDLYARLSREAHQSVRAFATHDMTEKVLGVYARTLGWVNEPTPGAVLA